MSFAELSQYFRPGNVALVPLTTYLLLSTVLTGNVATYLRERREWRDGYTRKLNHMGHGLWAALTIAFLPPAQLFPTITLATILVAIIYAISAGVSRPWYLRGIVRGSFRDRDVPRERFFFFLPLLLGNVGIVAAFALFPPDAARAAILVVAIGDGLAEPIGLRFGASTTYRVRDWVFQKTNTKSLVGNVVVALSALIVGGVTLWGQAPGWQIALAGLGFALLMSVLEAVSPRGTDNFVLTVAGSAYMNRVWLWLN